jgi:ring-1,2-phenylacetyl-CoA epoxidase subunit PaaD
MVNSFTPKKIMNTDIEQNEAATAIWQALHDVADPEIPRLSVVDLGVITHVSVDESNIAHITMTPTFSGCPAIHYMQDAIRERISTMHFADVKVSVSFEDPWNSNKITERGRAILLETGFAPPPKHNGYIELSVLEDVACPYCGSHNTVLQSPFGPTLCRSIHYCNTCSQAFEQFKPLV